jgi:hypothetical protein
LDIHPGRAKSVAAAIPSGRERIRRREGLRGHVVAVLSNGLENFPQKSVE